jgi:carboxymethylenebutenolidase
MNIRTEKVQVQVAGEAKPMSAYLAVPEGAGPFPAVIVIEEIFGINQHIRDVTERVAREGYVAIAPHMFHRAAPELDLAYDAASREKGMKLIGTLTAQGWSADLEGTLSFLRSRKDVRGDRIGIMGFCIGGHCAYYAACTTDVKATASFYGGGVATFSPGGGPPTVSKTAGIRGRILCLFGGQDSMIPPAQVDQIRTALETNKIRYEVVVYPEPGHAFFRDPDPNAYHKPSAEDAWKRVKNLFAEELKS